MVTCIKCKQDIAKCQCEFKMNQKDLVINQLINQYKQLESYNKTSKEIISAHEKQLEKYQYTIKRLEETIDRQDEEVLSNKYRVARLLHISDENDKLKQQLQEQEPYVELGKAVEKAFKTGCYIASEENWGRPEAENNKELLELYGGNNEA